MTAIFNASTVSELAEIITDRPSRGVVDGDIGIISGGDISDNSFSYTAELTATPVTILPGQIASLDGKVQWNLQAFSFADGGIPETLQADFVYQELPETWEESSADQAILYERIAGKHESLAYGNAEIWTAGSVAWLLSETGLQSIDTSNNNKTSFFESPIFAGESNHYCTRKLASTLCRSNGLIHLIGGTDSPQKYHHTFNTASGLYSEQSLKQLPISTTNAKLFDASRTNGCLYLFTQSLAAYRYNLSGNYWTSIADLPINDTIRKSFPDFNDVNSFIVIFTTSYLMYRFNAISETWTFITNLSGDGFAMPIDGFASYDFYSKRYVFIRNSDITYYDPALNLKTKDLANPNILYPMFDAATCAHLGNGYYIMCNSDDYYSVNIFSCCRSISARKVSK